MTDGDGGLLIGRLAARTGAYVVASSATQYYIPGTTLSSPINFGSWEGDVYLFGPNGNKRLIDWGWVPDRREQNQRQATDRAESGRGRMRRITEGHRVLDGA